MGEIAEQICVSSNMMLVGPKLIQQMN